MSVKLETEVKTLFISDQFAKFFVYVEQFTVPVLEHMVEVFRRNFPEEEWKLTITPSIGGLIFSFTRK
jgi:hypothetical protein